MTHQIKVVLSGVAFSLFGWNPIYAETEFVLWKNVGSWDINFYPGVPGCVASTFYEKGTTFFIGFERQVAETILEVTLMDKRWASIEAGKEYRVDTYFGDETPWTLNMMGADFGGTPGLVFAFDVPSESGHLFLTEFQRETGMRWIYDGVQLGNFTLSDSRAALQETILCQRSFESNLSETSDPFGVPNGDDVVDPFSE